MFDIEEQVVHDLRNAASVIRGAALQLHDGIGTLPPGAVERVTEIIARRSDLLLTLLTDLATICQADRGGLRVSMQRVDLAEVCRDVLAERGRGPSTAVTLDTAPDAVALADPVRVTQVLDKLVTNAVRYGGPSITVRAGRDGAAVRLEVSDDGTGVPHELLDKIFHAYARGPESVRHGGSGLGLAIVGQLCQAMGGTVTYDTSPGSRFTVTLPAAPLLRTPAPEDALPDRHGAVFWRHPDALADRVARYAAAGLGAGEAVVVGARPEHHALVGDRLLALGVDLDSAVATGQYVPLDALRLTQETTEHGNDPHRFEAVAGEALDRVGNRWQKARIFGEVVRPLGQQQPDDGVEGCWDMVTSNRRFALLCGYEAPSGELVPAVCARHDACLIV